MEKREYKKITIDDKIYSINNDQYQGYWDGKYINDFKNIFEKSFIN